MPHMTYQELRSLLPAVKKIPTLGGKIHLTLMNPPNGDLTAVNSKGSNYRISEADWANVNLLARNHPRNPWSNALYSQPSSYFTYGLIYAAAILRHISEKRQQAA